MEFSHLLEFKLPETMKPGKWMSIHAWYAKEEHAVNLWAMPQMTVRFKKEEKIIDAFAFRPERIIFPTNHWQPLSVDYPIPKEDFNRVEISLWRPQKSGSLFADNIEVTVFEE